MWRGIFEQAHVAYLIGRGLIQKLVTWLLWGTPLSEGRALIAYLIGRGLKPLWEVW